MCTTMLFVHRSRWRPHCHQYILEWVCRWLMRPILALKSLLHCGHWCRQGWLNEEDGAVLRLSLWSNHSWMASCTLSFSNCQHLYQSYSARQSDGYFSSQQSQYNNVPVMPSVCSCIFSSVQPVIVFPPVIHHEAASLVDDDLAFQPHGQPILAVPCIALCVCLSYQSDVALFIRHHILPF
jgi:hypothetical protein